MKKILIIMGRYLPGYKDGGPVRSIKNLVDRLGEEYDFRILAADRDHGDDKPYSCIKVRDWNRVGAAKVYYVEPGGFDEKTVGSLAKDVDLIYMCGCFNDYARTTLKLKKQGRIRCRVVIAAMGLFSPGAFHIKYPKKKAYMILLKWLRYFKNVEWSATSEEEAEDIRREAGKDAVCHLAEDLPRKPEEITHIAETEEGNLRVIFLSRISRKKNLLFAAKVLRQVKGNLVFDIYGNKEDVSYWEECEVELRKLPENVKWEYRGEADAERIVKIFSGYDVFLFPTMAENYGHVIFEALAGGCVPVISDKTPWTGEKMEGCGETVKLDEKTALEDFEKIVTKYTEMTKKEKQEAADRCIAFAGAYRAEEAEEQYRKMFG